MKAGMSGKEADKQYLPMFLTGIFLMLVMFYWHCYGLWQRLGISWAGLDEVLIKLNDSGAMGQYKLKTLILAIIVLHSIIRSGGGTKKGWGFVIATLVTGLLCFFLPYLGDLAFLFTSTVGYILTATGVALVGRKVKSATQANNDDQETFEQCDKLIKSEDSINIPTRYKYKGKMHNGWINVVNPFRASVIMGLPGAGKSYAIYYPFIDQMVKKRYSLFIYDYKFDDLTQIVYNKWLQYYPGKWVTEPVTDSMGKPVLDATGKAITKKTYRPPENAPQFCILNFDDPRKSMRCNPLNPKYLKDTSDAHEVAEIIMKNVNPKGETKEDFFTMSAKVYVAALIWQLKKYKSGIYCTFPHLIELMGKDYQKVFKILQQDNELSTMIRPFASALEKKALEQLEGQIASATIPLLKFPSPMLYWALSGDDFELDINNPDAPKIICMGNNPDRQAIYGTALALYTSRIFKVINHKYSASGKRNVKCGVLLDELPTIFIKGLDNLIATARSNKVAIVLGAQDKSQLVRDYSREEATVIFNTVGNIFAGQVNGETARDLSSSFGKEFRAQESETTGGQSDTVSRSFQLQELLPQSRIENLSQGQFCGRVADDAKYPISKKMFCGSIVVDVKERNREEAAYLKIPYVGEKYFDTEKVRRKIMDEPMDYYSRYMEDKKRKEYERKEVEDPSFIAPDVSEMWKEIEAEYKSLSPEQYSKGIEDTIKYFSDKEMMAKIADNYMKIQGDIDEMFETYNVDGNDDEEAGDESMNFSGGSSGESAPAAGEKAAVGTGTGFEDLLGGLEDGSSEMDPSEEYL